MDAKQPPGPGLESMTANLQTYSALQCLILFQTLSAHRSQSNAFDKIAHLLQDSALCKLDASSNGETLLNPPSLQELFEKTIQRLSKDDNVVQRLNGNRDSTTSNKKRRDGDTPGVLATEFVPLLYEDYKRRIIEDIRTEEQRYDQLLSEMKALQTFAASEEDHSAHDAKTHRQPEGEQVHPVQNEPEEEQREPTHGSGSRDQSHLEKTESTVAPEEKPVAQEPSRPRRHNASIDSIINHDEPSNDPFGRPSTAGSSNPPASSVPHESSHPPQASQPSQHPSSTRGQGSPHRYESHHPPDLRQAPSPRSAPPLPNVSSHSPKAPVILPPPPGMSVHPPPLPPSSPYSPTTDAPISSTYRTTAPPYATHPYPTHDSYTGPTRYPEPYPPSSQRDVRRPSSGTHSTPRPSYQHYPPQSPQYITAHQQQSLRGGVMLPPFQVNPPVSASSQPPQSSQSSVSVPPPLRPKNVPERLQLQDGPPVGTPIRIPGSGAQASPLSAPRTAHFRKPGVTVSPGSSTGWKLIPNESTTEKPQPRSISPISDREETPVRSRPTVTGRSRKGRASKTTEQKSVARASQSSPDRSQSVSSHVSELAASSRSGRGSRKMKTEPPGTPLTAPTEGDDVLPSATSKAVKRGQSVKRKRGESNAKAVSVSEQAIAAVTVNPPSTVVAYRNFGRMAQPVLNIISSHKHASMFAEPVRERTVPGYRDAIHRPQDLKSIRAAIAAGTRAVTAAVDAQQTSPNSITATGTGGSSTIILPVNELLIPPKGIVNAAQLEQEIMRMFANAVMFNAGDDEIVEDTREMFEGVEQALQQWRDVERMEESDELPKDDEGTTGSVKRRRL